MSSERPEVSFKELLLVPDGPPESVWRNALNYALSDADAGLGGQDGTPAPEEPDEAVVRADEDPGPDDDGFAGPPETGGFDGTGWDDAGQAQQADDEGGL